MSRVGLVCVAAGRGERFGGDKLEAVLGGATVLETALGALRRACPEAPLVVVVPASAVSRWVGRLHASFPDAYVVPGGDRRQDSVRRGVEEAARRGADVVAVHDAARPMVDPADVRSTVQALEGVDAAILCEVVTDTVKRVDVDGLVTETIPRERLRRAQTPQVLRVEVLERAWEAVDESVEWTDEAALVEAAGGSVRTVLATHPNPKLTTPADLLVMRALAETGS